MSETDLDAAVAAGIPQTFDDWMVVARGLAAGQRWAMDEAGTDRPQGVLYSRTVGLWLKEHPSFDRYSKAEQWAMLRCLERLEEIEAWRATLSILERARLNDPAKVLARFLAGDVPADSRDDRIARLDRKVAELRDEIARLRARE